MTAFDWIIALILIASIVLGLLRGLVAEVFSLGSWIVAFIAAKLGASAVAPLLPMDVDSEGMRNIVGFVVVFLGVMIIVMLFGRVVRGAVGAVGLGGADKAVGGVFGLLRGLVILVGLTLVAGLTVLPQTDFWKNALSSGVLERLATEAMPLLPAKVAEHIHFNG
ncbi:CvpA family protein [Betaproteobacteria bacterium SCN2]|jgi:membrane protein required for colicin V production|nr:CvpA family protein [Betaproteobacteria bacterium SCN2]